MRVRVGTFFGSKKPNYGSRRIASSSEELRATDTVDRYKKLREVETRVFEICEQTDRHVYRQADCNILSTNRGKRFLK